MLLPLSQGPALPLSLLLAPEEQAGKDSFHRGLRLAPTSKPCPPLDKQQAEGGSPWARSPESNAGKLSLVESGFSDRSRLVGAFLPSGPEALKN